MVALFRGEQSRPHESGRPGLGRLRRSLCERDGEQLTALLEMTAHEREHPEGSGQAKGIGRITLEQPLNSRANVFTLGGEPFESLALAGAAEFAIPGFGKREVVVGVTVAELVGGWVSGELLRGELADRLEHPQTFATFPHQALVEQGSKHI